MTTSKFEMPEYRFERPEVMQGMRQDGPVVENARGWFTEAVRAAGILSGWNAGAVGRFDEHFEVSTIIDFEYSGSYSPSRNMKLVWRVKADPGNYKEERFVLRKNLTIDLDRAVETAYSQCRWAVARAESRRVFTENQKVWCYDFRTFDARERSHVNVDLSKKLPGMMGVRYSNGGLTYKSIIPIGDLVDFEIEMNATMYDLIGKFPKPEAW